jgi:redox-sensitive bicupin YhaK (pirin superfamily)
MSCVTVRRSAERGSADHGWLKSKFSFSFADYHDERFMGFGPLRVLNDDTVEAQNGFPTHSHANFEIWSYILSGKLEHKDSLGHAEVLERGHIQFTSAGTGISHSEHNADKTRGGAPVRFLQIWGLPQRRGLSPAYQTGFFSEADKADKFCCVLEPAAAPVAGRAPKPLSINNNLTMHASILSAGARVSLPLREAYVHVPIMPGSAGIDIVPPPGKGDAVSLLPGDGAFLRDVGDGVVSFVGRGAAGVDAGGAATAAATQKTEFVVMSW